MFALAGLWDEYEDDAGHAHHTFTVITRPADDSVLAISERMPVLLAPESEQAWLNADADEALLPLLESYHPTLEHYSVSPLVNLPDRNSRIIIMPAPPADQHGNLSLFD